MLRKMPDIGALVTNGCGWLWVRAGGDSSGCSLVVELCPSIGISCIREMLGESTGLRVMKPLWEDS